MHVRALGESVGLGGSARADRRKVTDQMQHPVCGAPPELYELSRDHHRHWCRHEEGHSPTQRAYARVVFGVATMD
eukprot:7385144-Pyramimonas_sp.AAC.1